jgi:membrane-bound hydrogenase subunit mbhJ
MQNLSLSSSWQNMLDVIRDWARMNSPWAIHYNSGSCNGCDIEILATLTPRYDLERFGVKLQGSPRHADILICTGPVTRLSRERLLRTYHQMPEPKFVVAVGSCGLSGGVFRGCYNIVGDISEVIPVDMFIPGCPPRPEAIMYGLVQLLESMKHKVPTEAAAQAPSAVLNEKENVHD